MDIGLGVVGSLVLLVDNGILGCGSTAGKACVAVLGDALVDLLGRLGTSALDGLSYVVCGVLRTKMLTSVQNDKMRTEGEELESPKSCIHSKARRNGSKSLP